MEDITVGEVIDSMTEEQKKVLHYFVGKAINGFGKRIDVEGHPNGRYYIELPDGYRLIYDNTGYVGRYDPSLGEEI